MSVFNADFATVFSMFAAAVFGVKFFAAIFAEFKASDKNTGKPKEDTAGLKRVEKIIGWLKIVAGNAANVKES